MRYLNKIVFINSASVQYAEIELDGNVHLIGTQGVGKSTLLRAILFFYNANKSKLGIPKQKQNFDDYYFQYQNSYIIYEVIKDDIPFCVLAYKLNGKVAFRFFNSAYKRELFIDNENRAFESWEKIRISFGRDIYYTNAIKSYEDYRRIIYGDNRGLKPEFRKYALVESKQFQNIPRTIQNVLLNTNLEAKFIKDTIINSLNDEEFVIDIENYAKNHLRDFETQINDIKIWFKKNKRGEVLIRKQADKVIDRFRVYNFLKREKKDLAYGLASRMDFIETEKTILNSNFSKENNELSILLKKRENLLKTHRRREQDIISDIKLISNDLAKSKQKQAEYESKNIAEIIAKVAKKETLTNEQNTLKDEKNLLTSKFTEISQKFDALIAQIQNQQQEFANTQNAEINKINTDFNDARLSLFETYQKIIQQIREENQDEIAKANNGLEALKDNENNLKRSKAELKYKKFFSAEIQKCEEDKKVFDKQITNAKIINEKAENETTTIHKEWELEAKEVERNFMVSIEKESEKRQKLVSKIERIQYKIEQRKNSFYGWLNENYEGWQNTIGKVIDGENVLFNTELNPKFVDKSATLFGVELNLNTLKNSVKTIKEYQQEIEDYKVEIKGVTERIQRLNEDKEKSLGSLKTKFKKQLNTLKNTIAENDYLISQSEEKVKKNAVELDEWIAKANQKKNDELQKIEKGLEEIASKKLKAEEILANIKNGIKRKISLKEKERDSEVISLQKVKNKQVDEIEIAVENHKSASEKRIQELKKEQSSELDKKGADTKRLDVIESRLSEITKGLEYIKNNERIVIEYDKDKRELFDKVPQWKVEKASLEKKQISMEGEHKIELDKINAKCTKQDNFVKSIQSKLEEFKNDLEEFDSFQKSDAFLSIENDYATPKPIVDFDKQTKATTLIKEITDKHSKSLRTYEELRQAVNLFNGNFNEENIFSFKIKLITKGDFLSFASELKEFIEEDKIKEYEKRINERFAHIIRQIGRETTELNSKQGEIEKIIKKINEDFLSKKFIKAIKKMEMKTLESSNPIVKLLIQIKDFNDKNSFSLGEVNLFSSDESNAKNEKAIDLLKQLVKELEKSKCSNLTLSESFDLQFRIIENDNDSGWVEKLSNVGSNGTDILVKAMINISLLNVFKVDASKKFKDFKLHCMMDEIGTLHPTNQRGILQFANERNILLINGSPTSQNATDYKYTYKLAKEQSKTNSKKYITKINRLVKKI
ncbi:MAG: ATP-binding protein [Flavobacteriaceae bacterium]|nr:ATP-binding protein [Flavobacteriaceae bacterium]